MFVVITCYVYLDAGLAWSFAAACSSSRGVCVSFTAVSNGWCVEELVMLAGFEVDHM